MISLALYGFRDRDRVRRLCVCAKAAPERADDAGEERAELGTLVLGRGSHGLRADGNRPLIFRHPFFA